MRGDRPQRLGVRKVVAELLAFGLLAVDHGGADQRAFPQPGAQCGDQLGVLGPAFGQDVARAVEGGARVGHLLAEVLGRLGLRVEAGLGQPRSGQRLQSITLRRSGLVTR
jgi:hypothetical protein